MPVQDDLKGLGYKANPKSNFGNVQVYNHGADMHDDNHLNNLSSVLSNNNYRKINPAILPTWANKDNEDDYMSLHSTASGTGHRLFHDPGTSQDTSDDQNHKEPDDSMSEGFEIEVYKPNTHDVLKKITAKHNKEVQQHLTNMRSAYPKHDIAVINRHTGVSSLYRNKKVEEGIMGTIARAAAPVVGAMVHAGIDYAADKATDYAAKKITKAKDKVKDKITSFVNKPIEETKMTGKSLKEMFQQFEAKNDTSVETLSEDWNRLSHEAKTLVLHADNDETLHNNSHTPIMKNLARKSQKGVYDHEKAKTLWMYHAERAAHSYASANDDGTPWHKKFSMSARREAAKHWADTAKDQFTNDGSNQ